jgi:hypothetical protein
MPAHLARAAPPSSSDAPIAPHHLWHHLSSSQQQHVRQVLISVAKHVVAPQPHPSFHEETTHDLHAPPESSEIDSETS